MLNIISLLGAITIVVLFVKTETPEDYMSAETQVLLMMNAFILLLIGLGLTVLVLVLIVTFLGWIYSLIEYSFKSKRL